MPLRTNTSINHKPAIFNKIPINQQSMIAEVNYFTLFFFSVYAVNSQGCRDGWLHHGNSCYAFIDAEPDGWIEAMVIR